MTYFGERYLIPRIGRWASPDPLSIHAVGGGEALNSYHYIAGNLLQGRDPLGLCDNDADSDCATDARSQTDHARRQDDQQRLSTFEPVQAPGGWRDRGDLEWGRATENGQQAGLYFRNAGSSDQWTLFCRSCTADAATPDETAMAIAEVGAGGLGGAIRAGGRKVVGLAVASFGREAAEEVGERVVREAAERLTQPNAWIADTVPEGQASGLIERMRKIVAEAQADAVDDPSLLTRHLRDGESGLTPTNYGHALEEEVAERIAADVQLGERVVWTGRSNSPHDFAVSVPGRQSDVLVDITTNRQVRHHIGDPGRDLDAVIGYSRPQ